LILISNLLFAQNPSTQPLAPVREPGSVGAAKDALEVYGQSRNLDMMLKVGDQEQNIDFIKYRTDYKEEMESNFNQPKY
jgi:hypothetical protein